MIGNTTGFGNPWVRVMGWLRVRARVRVQQPLPNPRPRSGCHGLVTGWRLCCDSAVTAPHYTTTSMTTDAMKASVVKKVSKTF